MKDRVCPVFPAQFTQRCRAGLVVRAGTFPQGISREKGLQHLGL